VTLQSAAQGQTVEQKKIHQDTSFSHEWEKIVSLDGEWKIAEGNRQQIPT
jgi:hypothetical protein